MNKITFKDGTVITTKLTLEEYLTRYNRLDQLRVMTEGYDDGIGYDIFNKAIKAGQKINDFTGIIRLTNIEKDFLSCGLENESISKETRKLIEFYCRMK